MNIKRAIGASVMAYIASFIIGVIVIVVFGIDLGETQEIPPLMWYAGAIASIVFAAGFALWYFRSLKVEPSEKAGLYLGVVMITTGFILDFVTLLPLFTHEDPVGPLLDYYLAPMFWVTLLLVLLATTLTGKYIRSKRIRMNT
jgi:drug/metabolite transporter (DMT)-like permease